MRVEITEKKLKDAGLVALVLACILPLAFAVPVEAQTKGDVYRAPYHRIVVDSLTATHVCYRVLLSELTPNTVGRRYCQLRGAFERSRVLETPVEQPPVAPEPPEEPEPPVEEPPVEPPPPPPPPPTEDPSVYFSWDWNQFTTASQMRQAAMFCCNGTVSLETGTLPDGSTGKFMRAHLRGDGREDMTDFDIRIPGQVRELWLEFWVRFNDAWVTRSDDKTFFLYTQSSGRWELHVGPDRGYYSYAGVGGMTTEWIVSSNDIRPPRLNAERVWDGQWHRFRVYARMSSSSSARDGALTWWIDDTMLIGPDVGDVWQPSKLGHGVRTGSGPGDYFTAIRLGANADPQGSGERDWGAIRIWTTNPGW